MWGKFYLHYKAMYAFECLSLCKLLYILNIETSMLYFEELLSKQCVAFHL